MNILLIGSGGREHAIAWKVAQSPKLGKLYILPGNPGTSSFGENVADISDEHPSVVGLCREKRIDLVMVGPEAPLAAGIVDSLSAAGLRCFGPRRAAAQIESSKSFAKQFMSRHGIPTARFALFKNHAEAVRYLEQVDYPVVIKASGLAAGKGVILPETKAEALAALEAIMVKRDFGAGRSSRCSRRKTTNACWMATTVQTQAGWALTLRRQPAHLRWWRISFKQSCNRRWRGCG
jgi:phosphoribosylamine--glycine ligase